MKKALLSSQTLFLALSLIWISGCGLFSRTVQSRSSQTKEATILAVNDMHATLGHFPRLAFITDSLRNIYPSLLLVSAGDNQTGNPANDMYDPKGLPMIELMNDLGFAVSAVGNHEFDTGLQGFELLTHRAKFPFISVNVIRPNGSALKYSPYVILTLSNGTRVGFISLLDISAETGLPASHPDKVKGFSFLDTLQHALDYDAVADSVDIPVFLNHLGIEVDKKLADRLDARRYPLIIGGHSHTYIPEGTTENGVYLTQAKSNLKYATLIRITKSPNGTYGIFSQNIPIDPKGSIDAEVQKKVDGYFDNPMLHKVVGRLSAPLTNKEQIGYLFTDALRDASGADLALANGGGIRVPGLPAGDIEVKDIYEADPFGNEGEIYELTGSQIVELLHRHWVGDGYKICFPSGFVIHYEAEDMGEEDEEVSIKIFDLEGNPLDLRKTYSVAMNNYLSSAFLPKDLPHKSLFLPTAEITMRYISKLGVVPSYEGRKFVIVKGKK